MADQEEYLTRFNNVILIPTDFSAVADTAILHGLEFAQLLHDDVCLLHVYNAPADAMPDKKDAACKNSYQELLACKERCGQTYAVNIKLLPREGNLFKVVNNVVAEIKPRLMIMGTHGKQGLQHLFGSHALRVVLDSPCPVMVVQESSFIAGYRRIVLPVNSDVDPRPLIEWVLLFCKFFNSEIHLFQSLEINPDRNTTAERTISHMTGIFKENSVAFTIDHAASSNDFSGQVLAHANANRSDLVMTMTMPATDATGYSFSDWNEKLMFNPDRIPVMFIDRTDTAG